ncbi:hypothetical protein NKCBBBOE_01663 [Pseudarthrobacter sp. MM222]|nr:hypothetical protein NKCBBBOE_01663 [Pseudarthrobacter sp. MM222]
MVFGGTLSNPEYPQQEQPRVFDTSFDYKTDKSRKTKRGGAEVQELGDPDANSVRLRADHELLWTKKLNSGALFAPGASAARWNEYLIYTDDSGARHCYGSDAITSSYTGRSGPKSLTDAMAGLSDEQRARYLDPPYTIGSAMIWPVRSKDKPTMNQARGFGAEGHQIADRMDLTLECIRRHYAGDPESPLANVIKAYQDFFELFDKFVEFVDFFHLQDLVTPDYKDIRFFVPFEGFESSGLPADYITYREATLQFIAGRGRRMAEWVTANHPEIEVRNPWWPPR